MIKNYFKIAWRTFVKGRLYSTINITGLAAGIACCLTILIYVQKELSYDSFHSKADRIYRVSESLKERDGWVDIAWTSKPLGAILESDFPEVESVAQIEGHSGAKTIVEHDNRRFYETGFIYVNPSFFQIFDFPVLSGNPTKDLKKPYTVFLSQSMARKYFNNEDPVGQTLIIDNKQTYTVAGIFKDVPDNSQIQFDFVASLESRYASGVPRDSWMLGGVYMYVLLKKGADSKAFEAKLAGIRDQYLTGPFKSKKGDKASVALKTIALKEIHLHSSFTSEMDPQGDITYVYIFSAIAFLILLIACINYMNLATAGAINRARATGVRKANGAKRGELIVQYLSESFLFVSIALILAVLLTELFLPSVNTIMQRSMEIDWSDPYFLALLLGLWLIVGFGSGMYPAFYLSGFNPVYVLKGIERIQSRGWLRKSLVTFQLAISIALIVCTMVINNQMQLVRKDRPGFNREQVIMIPAHEEKQVDYPELRRQLLALGDVQAVTTTSFEPGEAGFISFLDSNDIEGYHTDKPIAMDGLSAGFGFVQTFGLHLTEGRSFDEKYSTDLKQSIIVNEAAVQFFGWKKPLGKTIDIWRAKRKVIGVLKNFHYKSLKEKMTPLVIMPVNKASRFIAVRMSRGDLTSTLDRIKSVWNDVVPTIPWSCTFLDDSFDALYRTELRLNTMITIFSFLSIFVACMGLVGLSVFTVEQRTKEIGIRKVLGAGLQDILALLTKDFIKWVVLGLLIAIPVAQYVMSIWLRTFEYKVQLGVSTYFLAGCIVLVLVISAISWQSIRAALADPVDSLRNE